HREQEPVLFPAKDSQESNEWPGGCEDPRLAESPDGQYVVTYTQYNRKEVHLADATSRDMRHWVKHGPVFSGTPFAALNCKSACVVSAVRNGHLVATRIRGQYYM